MADEVADGRRGAALAFRLAVAFHPAFQVAAAPSGRPKGRPRGKTEIDRGELFRLIEMSRLEAEQRGETVNVEDKSA